jgi:hypothetical protein
MNKVKTNDLRISATDLSVIEEPNRYSSFDSANLTNPAVYSAGLSVFGDFFKVNTVAEA